MKIDVEVDVDIDVDVDVEMNVDVVEDVNVDVVVDVNVDVKEDNSHSHFEFMIIYLVLFTLQRCHLHLQPSLR